MKKKSLFSCLFLLVFIGNVDAQSWFQEGDRWVYDYSSTWSQRRGYEELWIEGDTVINGQSCKVLKSQFTTVEIWPDPSNDTLVSVGVSYFVYEESDSIFLYNPNTDASQLLYDFSADVLLYLAYTIEGWSNNSSLEQTLYFLLWDTTSLQIAGQNRRVQTLLNFDIDNTGLEEHFISVVEGIGIVKKPLPGDSITLNGENFGHLIFPFAYPGPDAANRKFCSFTSDGEEYNPNNEDCYQLPMPVAVNNLSTNSNSFDLYPNPANTHFSIQNDLNTPIKKVTIFDAKGSVLKTIEMPAEEIEISNLKKGIYIIELEINEGMVYKKLVKN